MKLTYILAAFLPFFLEIFLKDIYASLGIGIVGGVLLIHFGGEKVTILSTMMTLLASISMAAIVGTGICELWEFGSKTCMAIKFILAIGGIYFIQGIINAAKGFRDDPIQTIKSWLPGKKSK